jgi:hypothetical protein
MISNELRALLGLLHDCLVQVEIGEDVPNGSGFFVAPGYVLTCAHVAAAPAGSPVGIRWREWSWPATVAYASPPPPGGAGIWPEPDIAIIRLDGQKESFRHCCARLASRDAREHSPMFATGRRPAPDGALADYPSAELHYLGPHSYLMRLAGDFFWEGMSGGPVLDGSTGRVCGMLKVAEDTGGGFAIPVSALTRIAARPDDGGELVREMLREHDLYHHARAGWAQAERSLRNALGPVAEPYPSVLDPVVEAALLGIIAGLPRPDPAELARLYRDCAGAVLRPDAGDLPDLRDVALRLGGLLHDEGKPHPVIMFAEALAERHERVRENLRAWAMAEAGRQGSWERLIDIRTSPPAAPPPPPVLMSATVQIAPSASGPGNYVFTVWRHRDSHDLMPVVRYDQPLSLQGVISMLKTHLSSVLGELSGSRVIVEFFLPAELFDEPVHEWDVLAHAYAKLGVRYPVVIRDPDRLQFPDIGNLARPRWHWLSQQGATALHWLDCDDPRSDEDVYNWYEQDRNRLATIGVPLRPGDGLIRLLKPALYAGVPVALWWLDRCPARDGGPPCPDPCPGMNFRLAADAALGPATLDDLPFELRNLRARGKLGDAVLLWDDPERGPHPQGLAVQ